MDCGGARHVVENVGPGLGLVQEHEDLRCDVMKRVCEQHECVTELSGRGHLLVGRPLCPDGSGTYVDCQHSGHAFYF